MNTTVLLVEDEPDLLENVSLDMEMRGYVVQRAGNGNAALKVLSDMDALPDIIVSDINMPEMDGFHLLEAVRSNHNWEQIPFLFLTAFNSLSSIRTSKELGADDYIVKPFHVDDLVLAMENKLKRIQSFRDGANRQLESARVELLNMMSHELRTPLMSIYGGMGLLRDYLSTNTDPFVQSMLHVIISGASRMNRLTTNALTLVQLDSGQMEALYAKAKQPLDLQHVIEQAIQAVNADPDLHERDVSIVVQDDREPMQVNGLAQFVAMMFEELLRNAVMFSPTGGNVTVDMSRADGMAIIVIGDQGPGMSPDQLETVWGRFNQVDRRKREQQGAGLGLALVWGCARLHGGECTLASAPGVGTRATLRLPLVRHGL